MIARDLIGCMIIDHATQEDKKALIMQDKKGKLYKLPIDPTTKIEEIFRE